MNAADWINLTGVVVSAGAAGFAVLSARRARAAEVQADRYRARAEQGAERATQAAEDSAASQRQSADAARRAADALEEQNQIASEQADLAEGVPWRIAFRTGSTYELWNESPKPKFDVQIGGEGVLRSKTEQRVDGRSSTSFMGLDASGVSDHRDLSMRNGPPKTFDVAHQSLLAVDVLGDYRRASPRIQPSCGAAVHSSTSRRRGPRQ